MANGAFGERIRMDCDETSDAASARGWTGCRGELRRLTRPGGSRLRYTAGTCPPPFRCTQFGHSWTPFATDTSGLPKPRGIPWQAGPLCRSVGTGPRWSTANTCRVGPTRRHGSDPRRPL